MCDVAAAPRAVKAAAAEVDPVPPLAIATVPVTLAAFPLTLPVKFAVIVPAEKLPLLSRATIAFAVFADVAVVAEFDTFPAVATVASLVSAMAAAELMSALTIESAVIAVGIVIFADPSKDWAVPVTSPETLTVRAVANLVALPAFPLVVPVTFPVTFPLKVPVIVPAEKFPDASL